MGCALACPVSAVTGSSVLWRRHLLALRPWGARPHGALGLRSHPIWLFLAGSVAEMGWRAEVAWGRPWREGRDREGLSSWSLAGAWRTSQAGEGTAGPRSGAGGWYRDRCGQCQERVHAWLSVSAELVSLKRWYVLFVSEEAKSSQRRKGLCQEQEDWANGRGNPAQERDEVADPVLLEKSWPSRVSGQFARQVTTSSFRALMTRQAPFQHGLDAEPRGEPRPSFRS